MSICIHFLMARVARVTVLHAGCTDKLGGEALCSVLAHCYNICGGAKQTVLRFVIFAVRKGVVVSRIQ